MWPKHDQQNEQDPAGCGAVRLLITPPAFPPVPRGLLTWVGGCSSLRGICLLAAWLPSRHPLSLPITSPVFLTFSFSTLMLTGASLQAP